MKKETLYKDIKITKKEGSEVEVVGSIAKEIIAKEKPKAISRIQKELTLPGFRTGHVPENVIIEKFGDMYIWEEAVKNILPMVAYDIVVDNNIASIGRPNITITKIVPNEDVDFSITVIVVPEVILPDYKKISSEIYKKEIEKQVATEEEKKNLILELRKAKAHELLHKNEKNVDHGHHDHNFKEEDLPVVDEEFIKTFGPFKTVADFETHIEKHIILEKERKEKDKRRIALSDALIDKTNVDVPRVLVEHELEKMQSQFENDVARMGVKLEDYLGHLKKTIDDIKKDWSPEATKRAKLALIISRIAEKEKIVPKKEQVEKEVSHILSHYKNANKENVEAYVQTILTNEETFLFLENLESVGK